MATARARERGTELSVLRLRFALGRLRADDYCAALRAVADELGAHLVSLRAELNALVGCPGLSETLRRFEHDVADGLRQVNAGKLDVACAHLASAESSLRELESYQEALCELRTARARFSEQLQTWKLERSGQHSTLRALRRALDLTGVELVRAGYPGRARELTRRVMHELSALSVAAPPPAVACRSCASDSHAGHDVEEYEIDALPSELAPLERRLRCDRATEAAYRAVREQRVGSETTLDGIAARARQSAERASDCVAALRRAHAPSSHSSEPKDAKHDTSNEQQDSGSRAREAK